MSRMCGKEDKSKGESKFEVCALQFLQRHPLLGGIAFAVGMPAGIILAVSVCTAVLMLPLHVFLGLL